MLLFRHGFLLAFEHLKSFHSNWYFARPAVRMHIVSRGRILSGLKSPESLVCNANSESNWYAILLLAEDWKMTCVLRTGRWPVVWGLEDDLWFEDWKMTYGLRTERWLMVWGLEDDLWFEDWKMTCGSRTERWLMVGGTGWWPWLEDWKMTCALTPWCDLRGWLGIKYQESQINRGWLRITYRSPVKLTCWIGILGKPSPLPIIPVCVFDLINPD